MITNERQYRITRAQAEKFEHALDELAEEEAAARSGGRTVHPRYFRIQHDALASQLETLHEELAAYEALRARPPKPISARSVAEIPRRLIEARIAAGLTQKQLAERLGLAEQQVQRYEATEYASASVKRVIQIARVLEASARAHKSA